jgi:hypothetical protein
MAARSFQHDPASRHTAKSLLEFGNVLGDGIVDGSGACHALKIDFERSLHDPSPMLQTDDRPTFRRHSTGGRGAP